MAALQTGSRTPHRNLKRLRPRGGARHTRSRSRMVWRRRAVTTGGSSSRGAVMAEEEQLQRLRCAACGKPPYDTFDAFCTACGAELNTDSAVQLSPVSP
mmetsp:Transcript_130076/g.362413  ORF Transcript_130076/g.362413 Transcript_130076/m.362413 type:complete len:99 (-) Transcript_130076:143-439(-)